MWYRGRFDGYIYIYLYIYSLLYFSLSSNIYVYIYICIFMYKSRAVYFVMPAYLRLHLGVNMRRWWRKRRTKIILRGNRETGGTVGNARNYIYIDIYRYIYNIDTESEVEAVSYTYQYIIWLCAFVYLCVCKHWWSLIYRYSPSTR